MTEAKFKQLAGSLRLQLSSGELELPKETFVEGPPIEIAPRILQGCLRDVYDAGWMKKNKTTHVLSVLESKYEVKIPGVKHLYIAVNDDVWLEAQHGKDNYRFQTRMDECFDFLYEVEANPGFTCLIHCVAGINRSNAVSASWDMLKNDTTFDQAINKIKAKRKHNEVLINPRFRENIEAWFETLSIEAKGKNQPVKAETKQVIWKSQDKCTKCRGISDRQCKGKKCYMTIGIGDSCTIYTGQLTEGSDDVTVIVFCSDKCLKGSDLDLVKNTDKSKGKLVVYNMNKKFCMDPLHRDFDWCDKCGNPQNGVRCSFCGCMEAFYKGYVHKSKPIACCQRDECRHEAGIWIPTGENAWSMKEGPEYQNYEYVHKEYEYEGYCEC